MPKQKTSIPADNSENSDLPLEEAVAEASDKNKDSKNDETKLDSQTRDMIKRVRDQKLVSGGRDPFFVSEKDKDSRFEYRWASTDKDTPESVEYLREIGWKEVEGYRTITTGGYTTNGQPGKHILMRLNKAIFNELLKINDELAERKKKSVMGKEVLSRDGGKNLMGSSTKIDDGDFLKSL